MESVELLLPSFLVVVYCRRCDPTRWCPWRSEYGWDKYILADWHQRSIWTSRRICLSGGSRSVQIMCSYSGRWVYRLQDLRRHDSGQREAVLLLVSRRRQCAISVWVIPEHSEPYRGRQKRALHQLDANGRSPSFQEAVWKNQRWYRSRRHVRIRNHNKLRGGEHKWLKIVSVDDFSRLWRSKLCIGQIGNHHRGCQLVGWFLIRI